MIGFNTTIDRFVRILTTEKEEKKIQSILRSAFIMHFSIYICTLFCLQRLSITNGSGKHGQLSTFEYKQKRVISVENHWIRCGHWHTTGHHNCSCKQHNAIKEMKKSARKLLLGYELRWIFNGKCKPTKVVKRG